MKKIDRKSSHDRLVKNFDNAKYKIKKYESLMRRVQKWLYRDIRAVPSASTSFEVSMDMFFSIHKIERPHTKKARREKILTLYLQGNEVLNTIQRTRKRKSKAIKVGGKKFTLDYLNYLQSNEWLNKRNELFALRGRICEECNKDLTNDRADVHHITYKSLFNERLDDLQVLCRCCHNKKHKNKKRHTKKNIK